MAEENRLTPQQRAQLFAQTTRQNWQMIPSRTGGEGETVQFDLPKVRLTSRVRLLVEAKVTATHPSESSYTPAPFAPFTALRRVTVDMNNGFSPFSVSGREL